jgi:hypothetical protein
MEPKLEAMLQYIHDDVREIKTVLNGPGGLIAQVAVLDADSKRKQKQLYVVWTALIAIFGALGRVAWDIVTAKVIGH